MLARSSISLHSKIGNASDLKVHLLSPSAYRSSYPLFRSNIDFSPKSSRSVRYALPNENNDGPTVGGLPLVPVSCAFYAAMTAGAVVLGKNYDILTQLQTPFSFNEQLPYLGVMLGLLVVSTALAEVVPSFKELKELYQRMLIPQLQTVPIWGLGLMAAGAGIGEEALFRAFFQTWITQGAATMQGATPELAVATGVFVASVVFGAAHSVTASYFIFATAAGAIFGIEYLNCGLTAAAFTHGIYDFIAFIAVIQLWGSKNAKY